MPKIITNRVINNSFRFINNEEFRKKYGYANYPKHNELVQVEGLKRDIAEIYWPSTGIKFHVDIQFINLPEDCFEPEEEDMDDDF